MKRFLSVVALFIVACWAVPASAQDTPLSVILIDGEEWVPADSIPAFRPELGRLTAALRAKATVVTAAGTRYTFDPDEKAVLMTPPGGTAKALPLPHLLKPAGLTIWPDGGTLVIGDAGTKHLWAYRLDRAGKLADGDRYYPLRVRPGTTASGVSSLAIDHVGRVYAATPLGVQFFDPTGRLSGVLLNPGREPPSAIAFSPAEPDRLIGLFGDKLYARKLRTKGVPVVMAEK